VCEILIVNANRPVPVLLSWRAFRHRGCANPDGWGFAYLDGEGFVVNRFLTNLADDPSGPRAPDPVRTTHFLAHVRYQIQGAVSPENTQPFLGSSGGLALASTMSGCQVTTRFRQEVSDALKGDTGPEVLLALFAGNDVLDVVRRVFVDAPHGPAARASFVLSDGETQTAFAFHRSLFWITRRPPHDSVVRLLDPAEASFRAELRLEKNEDEVATIVASRPLTDESWSEISHRQLVTIRNGVIERRDAL
jgi:predicted glutamine amidotransferase